MYFQKKLIYRLMAKVFCKAFTTKRVLSNEIIHVLFALDFCSMIISIGCCQYHMMWSVASSDTCTTPCILSSFSTKADFIVSRILDFCFVFCSVRIYFMIKHCIFTGRILRSRNEWLVSSQWCRCQKNLYQLNLLVWMWSPMLINSVCWSYRMK